MTLYIQPQEKKLIEACKKLHIPYRIKALKEADVQNEAGTLIAEVKSSANDFWASMVDKRLYGQLKEMYEKFKDNRYVFVKYKSLGVLAKEYKKNVNWVYSLFGEAENWGVRFREFHSHEDLARKLYSLDAKLGTEKKIRERVVTAKYNTTIAQRMIATLPGIGEKLSKDILKKVKNFVAFYEDVMTDQAKLDAIKGLSKKGSILKNVKIALSEMHK